MTKDKLIYLAVIVISGVFFILYRDPLSFILFLLILALPIMLLILAIAMRLGIRINVETGSGVCTCDQKAKIGVVISNYSILPVSQIKVFARYKNRFFKQYDNSEFNFFAPPLSKNRYEIEIESRHAGKIDVLFKKARVMDYFGVFSIPIRIKKEVSVSFLPKIHAVEPSLSKNNHLASESNLYSKHKPGDDPSEVFAIRDYVDGDKLSRVHWKLTSKQDKYMVKDYSLLINEAVMILPELVFGEGKQVNLDLIDGVLEVAFSLSHVFTERSTLHCVGYYNMQAQKVLTHKITDLDELYSAFGEIFNASGYYSTPHLALIDAQLLQNMSHVIYVSSDITQERCQQIAADKIPAVIYTIINVIPDDAKQADFAAEGVNVINVKKSRIFECLNDAVL